MTVGNHVFISYKREQQQFAFLVRNKLHEWGFETWLDMDRLQPGTQWADEIDQALKTCRACLAIMTPIALKSRYVTNEWDIAIMKGKLFVPLMFENTEPHYKYIDIQYIDFTSEEKEPSFSELKVILDTKQTTVHDLQTEDLHQEYLQRFFDRINKYLSAKLIASLRDEKDLPEPIRLSVERTGGEVDAAFEKDEMIDPLFAIGGIPSEPQQEFDDFSKAFDYYDGRILLLGEPGSGKTTTLLHYARDAAVRRRQDISAPLPILGIIPTWNADKQLSITEWLASSYGVPSHVQEIVNSGKALLLLDGLDELGESRLVDPNEPDRGTYDPRLRFIEALPHHGKILITCRKRDYHNIQKKVQLSGAVTLNPLSIEQIEVYLHSHPELLEVIEKNSSLREWLANPMLLSYFAYVYERLSPSENVDFLNLNLQQETQARDRIIETFIQKRYEHESPKIQLRQEEYTLEEVTKHLQEIALITLDGLEYSCKNWPKDQISWPNQVIDISAGAIPLSILGQLIRNENMVDILIDLNFLVEDGQSVRFIHSLVRDYFGYLAIEHEKKNMAHEWCIGDLIPSIGKLADTRHLELILTLADVPFFRGEYGSQLARALARFPSPESAEKLGHFLRVQRGHDQLQAYWALLDMGPIGEDALIESAKHLMSSSNDRAMIEQVLSLGKMSSPKNNAAWQGLREKWQMQKGRPN